MTVCPRKPDPQAKVVQLICRAHPGEETKFRAFKEICRRNDIEYRTVLAEKVDQFLTEHNWPPGNSQTLLTVFGAKAKYACSRCGEKFSKLQRVEFVSGLKAELCPGCLEHEEARHVVKKRMGLIQ